MSYGPEEIPIAWHEKTELHIGGNWEALRGLSETFKNFGIQAKEAADSLRPLDKPELWQGDASQGFRGDLHMVIGVLDLYAKVCPQMGTEVFDYSETVRLAKGECAFQIDPMAEQAYALLDQYVDTLAVYDAAKQQNDEDKANNVPKECRAVVPDKPSDKAAQDLLHKAQRQLAKAFTRATDAATTCMLKIWGHQDELKQTPDYSFNKFVQGIKDGTIQDIVDLAKLGRAITPARIAVDGPEKYFTDLASIAQGLTKPLYDPVGFAEDVKTGVVHNWDEFLKNPVYQTGRFVPDVALAFTPGGGAAMTADALAAATARVEARRIAGKEAAEKAAKDAPPAGDACTRTPGSCGLAGEPVDVATGEMVLDQTDVTLAGALPLVLRRRHRTLFDRGRWFGRRWASTLDQRLELGADGVVFVTEDGVEVRYPVPTAEASVLPLHGDRWPLVWDGRPGGTMTVTDPRGGRTWSFAPLPGMPGAVLPIRALHDRNGNRIDVEYDVEGVPCRVSHSGGYRVAVDSAAGRVMGLRLLDADPATHLPAAGLSVPLVTFGYGEAGNVTDVVNSSGRALRFTYDDRGRIISWTDRNGTWYQYTYDDAGRCVHGTGTDGAMDNTFEYDTAAQVTRLTDALGAVREFAWDGSGRVVAETDALGNSVRTSWDAHHRRTAVTDQLGQTTRYSYDGIGNMTGIVYPDGTYTIVEYDVRLCRPTQVVNPDGTRRRFAWDPNGNLHAAVDESGAETRYDHDDAGHLIRTTDALGAVTTVAPDSAGLPITVTDALGHTTTAVRDAFGRASTVTDPLGHTTRTAFTVEGKPAWRELPDGAREAWTWDAEGNLLHHLNAAGFTTRYESGAFDRPTAQTDPNGNRYEFTYDAELRLIAVTNPQALSWTYRYDQAGRLISETDFNGRTLTYRHDAAGHLTTRINGAGEQVDYARDVFGNVTTSIHTATGRTTTYAYDAAGRLARATNPDVDLFFTRDACGRILTETSNGRTLANTYDVLGRRIRRETPSGHTSEWAYNAVGRPTRLLTAGHTLDFGYDAAGRETTRHFGDNVTFTQTWDPADRLATQSLAVGPRPDKTTLALSPDLAPRETHRRTYSWRPDGYITAIDDTATGAKSYALDPTGRITTVTARGWTERYAYDSLGNITHAEWPTTAGSPSEDTQGERHFTGNRVTHAGRATYEYDEQGRLMKEIRRTLSGRRHIREFTWDPDDRLAHLTHAGITWKYTYDAIGRRTEKSSPLKGNPGSASSFFSWDGVQLVEHYQEAKEGRTWDYAPASWAILLQTVWSHTEYTTSAFLADAAGRSFAAVRPDGRADTPNPTNIWGAPATSHGFNDQIPMGLARQYQDPESGFAQNYFRYYNSECGMYISADPLGIPLSPHPYAYTSNPLSWLDPLGLAPCNVDSLLANWQSPVYTFGNETFMLDRSNIRHILTRHHPTYWDGTVKATQSFLDPRMSIQDVQDAIKGVLQQNRDTLINKGTRGMYQITGNVNGVDYVLGINNGHVGQFYPITG